MCDLFETVSCCVLSVCNGIVVDNIAAAQKLKGCTVIDNVLDIQMRGGELSHFLLIIHYLLNCSNCLVCVSDKL